MTPEKFKHSIDKMAKIEHQIKMRQKILFLVTERIDELDRLILKAEAAAKLASGPYWHRKHTMTWSELKSLRELNLSIVEMLGGKNDISA